MSTFVIGLSGGFGGIAPNLFRLGAGLQSGEPLPDASYAIGVLIFFVIGSGLALAFKEDNAKKAFFLGLSIPAMFQSGISDVAESASLPMAYAYQQEQAEPRYVWIHYDKDAPAFSFVFESDWDGRAEVYLEERGSETGGDGHDRIQVPEWAKRVSVRIEDEQSKSVTIPEESDWFVTIEETSFQGFKQSIGIKNAPRWRVLIEAKDEPRS